MIVQKISLSKTIEHTDYLHVRQTKDRTAVHIRYKWLQSLREIIIDNVRCPVAAQEFMEYEYERDKDGEVISGYPDGNDHTIDATRYATNSIWKRRGE